MSGNEHQTILPGIELSVSGEAIVSPTATQSLIDLAIYMEERSPFPLDVEHVLAGIIQARLEGDLPADTVMAVENEDLITLLKPRVDRIFEKTGGRIAED